MGLGWDRSSTMGVMASIVVAVLIYCLAAHFFVARHWLGMEVVVLRQQLVVFKRKQTFFRELIDGE
jgi:hypothetical protein